MGVLQFFTQLADSLNHVLPLTAKTLILQGCSIVFMVCVDCVKSTIELVNIQLQNVCIQYIYFVAHSENGFGNKTIKEKCLLLHVNKHGLAFRIGCWIYKCTPHTLDINVYV